MEQIARNAKQIGAVLRRQRNLLGLSQGSLGQRINLRQSTISSLESGDDGTKLGTLLDALSALDLELVIRTRTKGKSADIEEIF
jgi:HTH-type transcriptional regulator / antitoxin HipB